MKIIVCGGRDFEELDFVYKALDDLAAARPVSALAHGGARGADALARSWATERGIVQAAFQADWAGAGRGAGPKRNQKMLDENPGAQLLVAFPGGAGTADMTARARKAGLEILESLLSEERNLELAARGALYRVLSPEGDGVDYINVYSQGKTALGRALSNFSPPPTPIETPDGLFASVEGLWYFLRAGGGDERGALRGLSGFTAKDRGRKILEQFGVRQALGEQAFRARIKDACLAKLESMPWAVTALAESSAPLVHFYLYGQGGKAKVVAGEGQWLIDFWESVRRELR